MKRVIGLIRKSESITSRVVEDAITTSTEAYEVARFLDLQLVRFVDTASVATTFVQLSFV